MLRRRAPIPAPQGRRIGATVHVYPVPLQARPSDGRCGVAFLAAPERRDALEVIVAGFGVVDRFPLGQPESIRQTVHWPEDCPWSR